jgi:hypothetical protein
MTKKLLALTLVVALLGLSIPAPVFAGTGKTQGAGSLSGTLKDREGHSLANYTVRVRNLDTGQVVGTGTTNLAGEFTFTGLNPGTYVVEVLDNAGRVIGASKSIALTASVLVVANIPIVLSGVVTGAGAAAGGSFFATATGLLVAAAAGAGLAGILSARTAASPSKNEK